MTQPQFVATSHTKSQSIVVFYTVDLWQVGFERPNLSFSRVATWCSQVTLVKLRDATWWKNSHHVRTFHHMSCYIPNLQTLPRHWRHKGQVSHLGPPAPSRLDGRLCRFLGTWHGNLRNKACSKKQKHHISENAIHLLYINKYTFTPYLKVHLKEEMYRIIFFQHN